MRIKKKKPGRKHPPELVESCASLLRGVKPTPYRLEGRLVAHIRRHRVLAGWRFPDADESSRDLVLAALRKIGWGIRPEGIETSNAFATSDPRLCPSCNEPFVVIFGPGSDRLLPTGNRLKFCSFSCVRKSQAERLNNEEFRKRSRARAAARHQRLRKEMPEKPCLECGKMFHPLPERHNNPEQKYCSQDCFKAASASKRKAPPRDCEHCGEIFQSKQYGPQALNQRFCSRRCYDANRGGKEYVPAFACEAAE